MATKLAQDGYAKTALRLPADLHQAIREAAKAQDRSFNGQIVATLRAALLQQQQAQGATQ